MDMKRLWAFPIILILLISAACGLPASLTSKQATTKAAQSPTNESETNTNQPDASNLAATAGPFKAEVTSPISVILTWDDLTADRFLLEISVGGSDFGTLVEVPGNVKSYENFPAIPERTMQYRLTPTTGNQKGKSLLVEVQTPAQQPNPLTVTLKSDTTTPDPTTIDFSKIDPATMDPSAIADLLVPVTISATADIGPEGGEVSVTSSTGVKYTYRIPSDALDDTIPITLSPFTEMDGAPLTSGLLGAVDIQPSGLELNEPAVLTIEPAPGAAAKPDEVLTTFSFQGDGSEFTFTGVFVDKSQSSTSNTLKLASPVAQDGSWVMQPWDIPQDKVGPAGTGISTRAAVRKHAISNPPTDKTAKSTQNSAAEDDALAPIIPPAYLDILRRAQELSGWTDTLTLMEEMESKFKNAKDTDAALKNLEKAIERLVDQLEKNFKQNLNNCISKDDFSAYLGAKGMDKPRTPFGKIVSAAYQKKYGTATLKDVLNKAARCNIKLNLDSKVTIKGVDATFTLSAQSEVPLKIHFDNNTGTVYYSGTGKIKHLPSGGGSSACAAQFYSQGSGTFVVTKLYPVFDGSSADLTDFDLAGYDTPGSISKAAIQCPKVSTSVPFVSGIDMWGGFFLVARMGDFGIRNWQVSSSSPSGELATVDTNDVATFPDGSIKENSTFKITVNPQ